MGSRCLARTKDGSPCAAQPWRGDYCRWHTPELSEQRREWSRKGGAHRSNKARARAALANDAMDLRATGAVLSRMLRRLENGEIEPSVCTAASNLARELATLEEKTVIEDRLRLLEETAGIGERGTA